MTKRERIMAAINHGPVDRLPTDYWAVPEITQKLLKHFGKTDFLEVCEILHIDKIVNIGPKFLGREDGLDMWGIDYKTVPIPGGYGFYQEPVSFPLGEYNSIDEIEANYIWPSVEMFDYSVLISECEKYEGYAIESGYISLSYFYQMIRGTEQMLIDLLEEPELARYIIGQLQKFSHAHTKRILETCNGRIDISQVTDDFGTQNGLVMSPSMIDEFFGHEYDANIKLLKENGAAIFHHDDGAMTAILDWLVDKGIEILNPIQWHLPGWDLNELKAKHGKKICFHGAVDNQDVLPFGTVEDVRKEVEVCIEALFSDKTGFILAPCHNFQANTPIENVIEMYLHAHKLGKLS